MIDINELKTALAQIEQEKKDAEIALQNQLKTESDARRAGATAYISTLDLVVNEKSTIENKVKCYELMDYLRTEMNGKDGETRQELQKKIDELLILANQYKDLQRAEK